MEQLITKTLTDLIQLIIVVLGGMLINYLRKKFTQQQIDQALQIAEIAVKAAEAIGAANGFDGKAKFQQALVFVKQLAAKHGINLTDEQWQGIIEAAVHQLKALGEELKSNADSTQNSTAATGQ
ncbi:MAG: phage holin, LLH family [Moorellaceae bacterium]